MTRSIQKPQSIAARTTRLNVRAADTTDHPADSPAEAHQERDEGDLGEASVAELLRSIEGPDDDVLGFDAMDALEAIAADVIEDLLAAFAAHRGNITVRRRLGELMAHAGVRDGRIRVALLEILADDPVAGAGWLAAYGDRTVIPDLLRAYDATTLEDPPALPGSVFDESGEPHEDAYAIASALSWLGGALSAEQRAKLEEVLRRRDAAFAAFLAAMPPPPMPAFGERQSRNSHCRCGSGKKYKKCHLAADTRRP